MTGSAVLPVLAAVRDALIAAPAVAARVADRVAAGVPQGTPCPYVDLFASEVPDNTFGAFGRRVTVMLNVYGQTSKEDAFALLNDCVGALDFAAMTIDGWALVSSEFESSQDATDETVQGVRTWQLPAYFVVNVNRA